MPHVVDGIAPKHIELIGIAGDMRFVMPLCPRVQRHEQKDLSGEAARPSAAARASLSDHAHLANQFPLFGITGFRDRSLAQAVDSRIAHRTIVVGRDVTLSVNGMGGIIVIATIAIHPSGK